MPPGGGRCGWGEVRARWNGASENEGLRGRFVIEVGLAHVSSVYLQPGRDQGLGDSVREMQVVRQRDAGAVRVGAAHTLTVARLEGQQEMTVATEHPLELREHLGEVLRRSVDDRIPADGAAEKPVWKRESSKPSLLEADVRVRVPGDGEHRLRHVHTNDIESLR